MSGSSKRVLLLIVAGICSLMIVADAQAGIFRRGQNGRNGVFARRLNNRSRNTVTATTTTAATGAATSGQAATTGTGSGLSVRGQSPDGSEARTGANASAAAAGVAPPPALPPPGGARTPRN